MCSKMQIKEKQGGRYNFGAPERLRCVKMHDCTLLYYYTMYLALLGFCLEKFWYTAFVLVSLLLAYSISMR